MYTDAGQAVKHLVDNLRLASVATLPNCGSYATALHLSRRPQAKQPVATAAQRKQAAQRPRSSAYHLPVCEILENQMYTAQESKVVWQTTYHTTPQTIKMWAAAAAAAAAAARSQRTL